MIYKVVEVSEKGEKEKKLLYKGDSKEKAITAYNQPPSLPFSHKRFYENRKRLYAYEL